MRKVSVFWLLVFSITGYARVESHVKGEEEHIGKTREILPANEDGYKDCTAKQPFAVPGHLSLKAKLVRLNENSFEPGTAGDSKSQCRFLVFENQKLLGLMVGSSRRDDGKTYSVIPGEMLQTEKNTPPPPGAYHAIYFNDSSPELIPAGCVAQEKADNKEDNEKLIISVKGFDGLVRTVKHKIPQNVKSEETNGDKDIDKMIQNFQ